MRRPRPLTLLLAAAMAALVPAVADPAGSDPAPSVAAPAAQGYWLVGADGGIFSFGTAGDHGSATRPPSHPAVAVVPTPTGRGYWVGSSDGTVDAFGDAGRHGSMAGHTLNRPIAGMAATTTGGGNWLVATDGGIFSFGDAAFYGSTGDIRLNKPIVGMTASPTGKGYWMVASDGGIFSFGDAAFYGSTGAMRLNQPIVGMASSPTGKGYWLVASDGGIFSFGDAAFYGSTGDIRLNRPIVGMASSPTGQGYRFVASDGGIFSFGDVAFHGSAADRRLAQPIVSMAAMPAAPASATTTGPPAATGPTATMMSTSTTTAPPAREPFEVGLIGDTGYTATSDWLLEFAIAEMNTVPLAFVVHDGDIMAERVGCADKYYDRALAMMNSIAHPVVYTPGDNEWIDCPSDPAGHLAKIRSMFFADDQSVGGRRMTLTRQAAPYVENQRWERDGVVFATFHVVNSTDNLEQDPAEHHARRAANLEWLRETFARAAAADSAGVMLVTQVNPFPPSCASDDAPSDCVEQGTGGAEVYESFLDEVYRLTAAFARPVVIVHGDTHIGRIDRPVGAPANLVRVETFAESDTEHWMHVKVDASSPAVFDVIARKAPKTPPPEEGGS